MSIIYLFIYLFIFIYCLLKSCPAEPLGTRRTISLKDALRQNDVEFVMTETMK